MANKRKIEIYTDGSGDTSRELGASAVAIYVDDKLQYEWKACLTPATNNVAEMVAVMKAYQLQQLLPDDDITVCSDSKYVLETINGKFKVRTNKRLWKEMLPIVHKCPHIAVKHVKGHSGDIKNNRVDNLAKNHLRQERNKLK